MAAVEGALGLPSKENLTFRWEESSELTASSCNTFTPHCSFGGHILPGQPQPVTEQAGEPGLATSAQCGAPELPIGVTLHCGLALSLPNSVLSRFVLHRHHASHCPGPVSVPAPPGPKVTEHSTEQGFSKCVPGASSISSIWEPAQAPVWAWRTVVIRVQELSLRGRVPREGENVYHNPSNPHPSSPSLSFQESTRVTQ